MIMYDLNKMCNLRADCSKTIRLDHFTIEVIMNYRGKNFSAKLRNYVFDVENGIHQKCSTKVSGKKT